MDKKLAIIVVLGLFIVLVALVSSLNVGFSVTSAHPDSLKMSYFLGQGQRQPQVLQTITARNDFFLPRSYELPAGTACLLDTSGKYAGERLDIRYSWVAPQMSAGVDSTLYPNGNNGQNGVINVLELGMKAEKKSYLVTTSYYYYTQIWHFDQIAVFRDHVNDYNLCNDYSKVAPSEAPLFTIPLTNDLTYTCPSTSTINCYIQNSIYCESMYQQWITDKCPSVKILNQYPGTPTEKPIPVI